MSSLSPDLYVSCKLNLILAIRIPGEWSVGAEHIDRHHVGTIAAAEPCPLDADPLRVRIGVEEDRSHTVDNGGAVAWRGNEIAVVQGQLLINQQHGVGGSIDACIRNEAHHVVHRVAKFLILPPIGWTDIDSDILHIRVERAAFRSLKIKPYRVDRLGGGIAIRPL